MAAKTAADRALEKEEEKLRRYQEQISKSKIYAPHDGMVVYATDQYRRSSGSSIAEGAMVRQRQSILYLPDLSEMQVQTAIHESVLDKVSPGLPVSIQIDAFPDRTYRGHVETVGVVPDQRGWSSSDIKVYETIVLIDEHVEQLKPGMSGTVEIHVDRLKSVLSVPVQAVVDENKQTFCYVVRGRTVERRPIRLGPTNDKFVQVHARSADGTGVAEGETIVLNPMVLMQSEKSAEAGPNGEPAPAVGTEEEAIPAADAAESQADANLPDGKAGKSDAKAAAGKAAKPSKRDRTKIRQTEGIGS
jgi:RND family efflux transporter MFP subunit